LLITFPILYQHITIECEFVILLEAPKLSQELALNICISLGHYQQNAANYNPVTALYRLSATNAQAICCRHSPN